jgi:hypothetical protein
VAAAGIRNPARVARCVVFGGSAAAYRTQAGAGPDTVSASSIRISITMINTLMSQTDQRSLTITDPRVSVFVRNDVPVNFEQQEG